MSRGSKSDARDFETNHAYGQISADSTPEFEEFKAYKPDKTLLNAGTTATFDMARRGITEGTSSPYSGVNPVLRSRMQALGMQELATKESGALADADLERDRLQLEQKRIAMEYKKPQILETKTSGFGQQQQQSGGGGGGIVSGIISGVGGAVLAF